jgi:hypothetical protein
MEKEIDIKLFEKVGDKIFYNNKQLKIHENSQGYQYVTVNGKSRRLHRLIALKYVENPFDYRVVDHKDGCKINNEIDNLQWISYSDNSKKAYNNTESMKNMHKVKNTGRITSEKDGVIMFHDSLRKCGTYLGRDVAAVYRCLDGEWSRCNGHKLYYSN